MQDQANGEHAVETSSFYGYGLSQYVLDHEKHHGSAFATARYVLTHGERYPEPDAVEALAAYDRAAYEVLATRPELAITSQLEEDSASLWLAVNSLGRLHVRAAGMERPSYGEDDHWTAIGYVRIGDDMMQEIMCRFVQSEHEDALALTHIRDAMDRLHAANGLDEVVDQVIDHVEHVESVCFYVGDRFFALIDRYVNLIDSKGGKGFLPPLRDKPYEQWSDDELLIVAALHALFTSGRAVRFEEFNGVRLSPSSLLKKLSALRAAYYQADGMEPPPHVGTLFELAREIRELTLRAVGKPWLRYRWIYALTFQKKERVIESLESSERADAHLVEFGEEYLKSVTGAAEDKLSEQMFFTQLACAYLARDLVGKPFDVPGSAADSWTEHLIERVVGSAVRATEADYGMSSSLRDIGSLVEYDEDKLVETLHKLTPMHFFTCFVSNRFGARLDPATASMIASSVQRRMMFNRWHFIPGNFERNLISSTRHWYYPPLVPDIAIHSDVHRGGHSRAMVKFSIRSPGPDMGRPPLQIANRRFRGFYDIRVVRMSGQPFNSEELLRVRRRTIWLENVFAVIVAHLQGERAVPLRIRGFAPGRFMDLPAPARSGNGLGVVDSRHLSATTVANSV